MAQKVIYQIRVGANLKKDFGFNCIDLLASNVGPQGQNFEL